MASNQPSSSTPATPLRPKLIRMRGIKEMGGPTPASVYRAMKWLEDPFPSPVRLGPNQVAWVLDEVEAWLDRRISARNRTSERA